MSPARNRPGSDCRALKSVPRRARSAPTKARFHGTGASQLCPVDLLPAGPLALPLGSERAVELMLLLYKAAATAVSRLTRVSSLDADYIGESVTLTIQARFDDFYLQGTSVDTWLPASWPQLVRSAATVGRDVSWTRLEHDRALLRHERIWRIAMMRGCLRETAGSSASRLVRTSTYATLDPAEKGAVSFFLGQALAKYVAEVMFDCIVFAHLDSALQYEGLPRIGQRPDFIGLCRDGRTLIVEAKGRSQGLAGVLSKAKTQLSGLHGDVNYACASYFANDELRVAMLDPEYPADEIVPLRGVLLAHYNPIRAVLNQPEILTVSNREFRVVTVPDLGLALGLSAEVLQDVQSLESRELPAREAFERIVQRSREMSMPVAASPGPTENERHLRDAVARGAELRAISEPDVRTERPDELSSRVSMRVRSSMQPSAETYALATRATEARGIVASDESFVELGESWRPEEMSREPSDRS